MEKGVTRRQLALTALASALSLARATGSAGQTTEESKPCMKRSNLERFRVLSLDGGGVRGVLTARILSNIEDHLNRGNPIRKGIGQQFDLIAGTSTGGIIALALSIGLSAKEILGFYEIHIPKIFSSSQKRNPIRSTVSPKYSSDQLRDSLREIFDEKTLNDVLTDVCITGVALNNAKPRFHKTDYLARNRARLDEKLIDVALATSAAPTYFKAHTMVHSTSIIDGGVCANNPALVAIVDSLQFERPSKRGTPQAQDLKNDLVMLSIGTGEQPSMPYDVSALSDSGWAQWAGPIVEVLFESQSQLVHSQAQFLLNEHYLRVNPALKFPMKLDDVSMLDELKNLSDMTKEVEVFLTRYLVPSSA